MNSLSNYYFLVAFLIFIGMIMDFIIGIGITANCNYFIKLGPFNGTASPLLLLCGISNLIILILLIILSVSIHHLSELDPDELRDRSLINRITGTITKTFPFTIKFLHYIKVLLFLVILFGFFLNSPQVGQDYLTGPPNIYKNDTFFCNNTEYVNRINSSYVANLSIYVYYEGSSIYLILCILGAIKSMIYEEAFIYQPVSRESGATTKCFCHYLGP